MRQTFSITAINLLILEKVKYGFIEQRLGELFEPYMRRGKDKANTDADEDRDDSNDIEDAVISLNF